MKDFTVNESGKLTFTAEGLKNQKPLFDKAGIDIDSIKTLEDYQEARSIARPYFREYIQDELHNHQINSEHPNSLGWKAINSIVTGTKADQDKYLEMLRKRKHLKSI